MLDIQSELHDAGQPYQDIYEAVAELKRRHDLHPCAVRPRDGLSLRNDDERETVQDLVARFRRLPDETRRKLPALQNSLAQLEVVIGDLEASLHDFEEVARLVEDPISRAEAHHNVHRAALERRDWDTALAALRRAVALDADTFEPFPFSRYEPQQILGGGGFGVSFLCHDRTTNQSVVVKTLRGDSLDRDIGSLFRETKSLHDIDQPTLVRVLDHAATETSRAYLVLEYVEGEPLSTFIARHGPLSPDDWLDIAWPIARTLQSLHARGILHRSLHPAAVLVRRIKNRDGGNRLAVKLLDVGLGLRRAVLHASASSGPEACRHSGLGRTVAHLLPYLPPEVVGRPKGQVWVGPHSDIYSFGRLCLFGLTGRPDPGKGDLLLLSEVWQKLLADCTAWTMNRRPAHVGLVLDRLTQAPGVDGLINRIERDLHEATIAGLTALVEADPDNVEAYLQRASACFHQGDFAAAIADYTQAIQRRAEDASLYRRRALAYSRNNNLDETIADYTQSLRLEPRNLEALTNRGLTHATRGEQDQAIADYTEGLRIDPHDGLLYYNRGNAHYIRGDFDRAIADYTEALRIDPRHLWALGNRGKAFLLNGEPARAVADFTRLLYLDPANVRALCDRASGLLDLGQHERALADYSEAIRLEPTAGLYHERGQAHASAGNINAAIEDFTEAVKLSPDSATMLISRGKAHADAGQFEEAITDFTEAIRIAPQSTSAYQHRASVFARTNRFDEAIADCTQAISLTPTSPGPFFQRGNLYAEANDQDRAIADFTEVIRLDPEAAAAFTNRGNSYARQGEAERARADYDQALALDPDDALTLFNRASVHLRLGNTAAALADYTETLRLDPANARAHSSRGLLLAREGEVDRALADFTQAIRLEPNNPRPYNHRGNLLADRGQFERAIADFSEAIRLDAGYTLAWYNRGIAQAESGNHEAAIADFTEVLRLEPNQLGALINRAASKRRMGDLDGALADLTTAIGVDPNFVMPYYNRASLLCERGDHAAALADLDAVLRLSPDDVSAYISRGRIHSLLGDFNGALADNLAALERAPDDPRIANNLAWLYATSPDPALRDPARAVEMALRACAAGEDATRLDTLAAAYAACGRFSEAAEQQRRAMDLAQEHEKDDFRSRLLLYEAGQMFVQPKEEST